MKFRFLMLLVLIVIMATTLFAQTQPEVFDVNVYEGIYADLFNAYGSNTSGAQNHWVNQGLPVEGRRASFIFDPVYYIAHNPGVPTGYLAALQDFMNNGLPAGKRGSLEFDVKYYLARYSDLAAAFGTNYLAAADHFLNQGLPCEGRQGSADFAVQDYINNYPDVGAGYPKTLTCTIGPTDYKKAMMQWLRRGKAFNRQGVGSLPVSADCGSSPVSGYQRAFFTHRTDGAAGDGSFGNPFDASVINDTLHNIRLDDTLRHISEQTPGHIPINQETQQPYGPYNLIVCLDDSGVFQTRGNWDWLINQRHRKGNPDGPVNPEPGGFTVNRNWHIHGKGANRTTVQLYDYVPDPTDWSYPPSSDFPNTHSGLGIVFGTYDDNVGNVEISDMIIDTNYAALKARNPSIVLNLMAINLRSDVGGHNIHNINVMNLAGEVGGVHIRWEAFPIYIVSASGMNVIPEQAPNNQIKYVLMSNFAPGPGGCTAITVANVVAEVAFNVVNGWYSPTNQFGACQAYGGFSLSNAWFHDNIAFNSVNGFLTDSGTNRKVTIEFNQFNNPNPQGGGPGIGIVVGGGGKYDYYTIQYNTITMAISHNIGIFLQGNVHGAAINNNNLLINGLPSGVIAIFFKQFTTGNLGNAIQYNQVGAGIGEVPDGNCVFTNWDTLGNPLASPPPTQSSPCAAPAQAYATLQTDSNFVVNGAGATLWATNTAGTNAPNLLMQDDGNLVLYKFIWQAGTYVAPQGVQIPYDSCRVGATLFAGQTLAPNSCLESASGQYFLLMQSDGNLVLYDRVAGQVTWASNTYNHAGAFASMQTDGNFVVYQGTTPLWASNTSGSGANRLDMQDDGRIILYAPVWNTGTAFGPPPQPLAHPQASECTDVGPGIGWTGVLGATSCFVSPNGRYKLYMQPDGRLVLYDRSATPMKPLWTNN